MRPRPTRLALALLPLFGAACASTAGSGASAPLFDDLGDHHHAITADVALSQRYFDQGLTLAYGFNHLEAERSFRAVTQLDPDHPMGWWGVALVLGPNINKPMDEASAASAWMAIKEALARKDNGSDKERAYVEALAARYVADAAVSAGERRNELDIAYADAMRMLSQRFPADLDAATLFAEALMDITPWDYWTPDGEPTRFTSEIVATLESVLDREPYHVGACHYYIHAVEASKTPERAESAADRLGDLAPGQGHLVHMPSHIYMRVGRYHDASIANEKAAAADESYIGQCNRQGFYAAAYYPHNIHFLWASASMEGRSELALATARKLVAYMPRERIEEMPFLEEFLPVPYYTYMRFGLAKEMLDAPQPAAEHAFTRGMWHYGRGLALVMQQDPIRARTELRELVAIQESKEMQDLELFSGSKAASLLAIARNVLEARLANAGGDKTAFIAHLRDAAKLQDGLPYSEPPPWYFPVRQALGNALLSSGRFTEAEAVFREELVQNPRNGWSLFGLERSLRVQGKAEEASAVRERFEEAWGEADVRLGAFSSCCGAAVPASR